MRVQGAERYLHRSREDMTALETKVMRIHVECHTMVIGDLVTRLLAKHGFRIVRNASAHLNHFYEAAHGGMGRVAFRSGYVFASNTRFENTLGGAC